MISSRSFSSRKAVFGYKTQIQLPCNVKQASTSSPPPPESVLCPGTPGGEGFRSDGQEGQREGVTFAGMNLAREPASTTDEEGCSCRGPQVGGSSAGSRRSESRWLQVVRGPEPRAGFQETARSDPAGPHRSLCGAGLYLGFNGIEELQVRPLWLLA